MKSKVKRQPQESFATVKEAAEAGVARKLDEIARLQEDGKSLLARVAEKQHAIAERVGEINRVYKALARPEMAIPVIG